MADKRGAIITGASRGIGRATAIALANAGFAITVNYARQSSAAEEVVRLIRQRGGDAIAVQALVEDRDGRQRLLDETMDAFGAIEMLVNNAAVTSQGRRDVLEATEESWDAVFATNLKAPFFLTQAVAKIMIGQREQGALQRGTIINISSISAYAASTNRADYCLTKAAQQMMTWLFAARLAEANINVYELCPGIIATDMTSAVKEKYDRLIGDGLTPIRRWGQPEDIAKVVVALASGAFAFSTGERINVDGGFHVRQL
jgi:NAD(P)-dependent dehydrogenase (short-subunit alcohol dehydrogenase family)